MTKPKAKLRRGDGDKDASTCAANVEAKDGDSSGNNSQTVTNSSTSWYTSEIRSMMFGFGDCANPCVQSAKLVEKVVHQQMSCLLLQAAELAESRGAKVMGLEDFLFLLRKDKIKLARLVRYMSLRDLKANAMKDVAVEPQLDHSTCNQSGDMKVDVVKNKRRKLCQDFLASIDQTGEFGALFDEQLFDDVRYDRDKRAELCTRFMDDQQYFKFAEARQISFARKSRGGSNKFRDWLLQDDQDVGNVGNMLKPDTYAMEVVNYLAFETVAQIVDLALLVKHDAQRSSVDPIRQLVGRNIVNADFPCVRAPSPTNINTNMSTPPSSPSSKARSKKVKKVMEGSNYLGGGECDADAASANDRPQLNSIQPGDVREAIRRFYHPLSPFAPFKRLECTHLGNVLLCS